MGVVRSDGCAGRLRAVSLVRLGVGLLATGGALWGAPVSLELTTSGASGTIDGAYFVQGPGKGGTGVLGPFVRIQAQGNNPTEEGYNTGNTDAMPDVKGGTWTHELLLSEIPITLIGGIPCFEFLLDINQDKNSNPSLLSLDDVEIWVKSGALADATTYASLANSGATRVYFLDRLDAGNEVLLNYALESGSGVIDMAMYVPVAAFGANPGDHVYLFSQFGFKGGEYVANAGFEEWAVAADSKTPTFSLGNRVFADTGVGGGIANDGIQNGGEPGIQGVTVKVYAADVAGNPTGPVLMTQVTDADGWYRFDGLLAGNYVAVVDVADSSSLQGWITSPGASTDTTIAGDLRDHGQDIPLGIGSVLPGGIASAAVTLGVGLQPLGEVVSTSLQGAHGPTDDADDNLVVDFGFRLNIPDQSDRVSIGSLVFLDQDNNGIFNGTDVGIGGVTVQLFQVDIGGNLVLPALATTTTATDGTYFFGDLPSGRYQVLIPNSNFGAGQALVGSTLTSGTPVNADDQVDDDNNGVQTGGGGTDVWSPIIQLTVGLEPLGDGSTGTEAGPGGGQDDINGYFDANGDMTVDFGFRPNPPTAVRLAYFHARRVGGRPVQLDWRSLAEIQTLGYYVERRGAADWERVSPQLIAAGGQDLKPHAYTLSDPVTTALYYRLVEVDLQGNAHVLAFANVTPGARMQAALDGHSFKVQLHGAPNGRVTVESAPDVVNGPWSAAGSVTLDGTGGGALTLPVQKAELMQFLRLLEE